MWCVRVGDTLIASNSIKKLDKYLGNPRARLGVWVEITWIEMKSINSYAHKRMTGFFDINEGEFYKSLRKDWDGTNKFLGDSHISPPDKFIADRVWKRMKDTWQERLKKEI